MMPAPSMIVSVENIGIYLFMLLPLQLLICDACEEIIADGLTAMEARKEGAKLGYVRIKRVDLCAKCAKKPSNVVPLRKRH